MPAPVTAAAAASSFATAPIWRRRCAAFAAELRRAGFAFGHGTAWHKHAAPARRAPDGGFWLALRAARTAGFVYADGEAATDLLRVTVWPSSYFVDLDADAVLARALPSRPDPVEVVFVLDLLGDTLPGAALLAAGGPVSFSPVYDLLQAGLRHVRGTRPADALHFHPRHRARLIAAGYVGDTAGWGATQRSRSSK